jgi:hypothetical protein
VRRELRLPAARSTFVMYLRTDQHRNRVTTSRQVEADDGIRTRDPHLGNVKRTVRRVRPAP